MMASMDEKLDANNVPMLIWILRRCDVNGWVALVEIWHSPSHEDRAFIHVRT